MKLKRNFQKWKNVQIKYPLDAWGLRTDTLQTLVYARLHIFVHQYDAIQSWLCLVFTGCARICRKHDKIGALSGKLNRCSPKIQKSNLTKSVGTKLGCMDAQYFEVSWIIWTPKAHGSGVWRSMLAFLPIRCRKCDFLLSSLVVVPPAARSPWKLASVCPTEPRFHHRSRTNSRTTSVNSMSMASKSHTDAQVRINMHGTESIGCRCEDLRHQGNTFTLYIVIILKIPSKTIIRSYER